MKITGAVEFIHIHNQYPGMLGSPLVWVNHRYVALKLKSRAVTLAYVVEDHQIRVGVARTNLLDQFVKKTGRAVAEEHLQGGDENNSFVITPDGIDNLLRQTKLFDKNLKDLANTFAVTFSDLAPHAVRDVIIDAYVEYAKHVPKVKNETTEG